MKQKSETELMWVGFGSMILLTALAALPVLAFTGLVYLSYEVWG